MVSAEINQVKFKGNLGPVARERFLDRGGSK